MRVSILILLAILPLFSACKMVESEKPLSSPRAAVADERLEGLWRSTDGKKSEYLYFVYGPHGIGSLMNFDKTDAGQIGSIKYDFFVTRTPKHEYLNLNHCVVTNATYFPPRPGIYTFVEFHYSWTGQLVYRAVGGDAFAKAIDEGRLRGKVYRDDQKAVTETLLTDTGDHILQFMESSKPKDVFFDPPMRMSKIGGP